jgi:hypothetical protein
MRTAFTPPPPLSLRRLRDWLASCHSLRAEAVAVLTLYALYEAARGLVVCDEAVAVQHARHVVLLERALHVFVEADVQGAAREVPGLVGMLGAAYLTLHLGVTVGVLLWVHRRRPSSFPLVRTTLLVASGLALFGFVVFPTAPPRLAGIGIVDTVSGRHVDLNEGLVSSLYNPYAAVPSMHIGYAVVVATTLARHARTRTAKAAGITYPLLVLVVIVATGNHFFFDAVVGAAVVAVAAPLARLVTRQPRRVPVAVATADATTVRPSQVAA